MADVEMNRFESKSSGLDSGADTLSNSDASSEDLSKPNGKSSNEDANVIAIIGSGDFGRGLALRMVQSGFVVNIGSRNPERNR